MNRPSYGYSAGSDPSPDSGSPRAHSSEADKAPTCPRHPDQVTYVTCQRCDRPTCTTCQRPAAVGVRCVDCERQLSRSQSGTTARTVIGAPARPQQPVVTFTLLALIGIMFIGQLLAPRIVEGLGLFIPVRAIAMPWTFVTAGFLHGGIAHLLLNGWALYVTGRYLEQVLGAWRFTGLFLVSVIGGHVAVFLLGNPDSQSWLTGTLGASGGVFGLFGAMFVVGRRMGSEVTQILILIGLNIVFSFTFPGISWQGHLGGLIFGTALTAAMFALRPKALPGSDREALAKKAATYHALLIVGALVLALALVAVKVAIVGTGSLAMW